MEIKAKDIQEEVVSKAEYEKLLAEHKYLKHQFKELQRLIFGSKSERFVPTSQDASQLDLFDEKTKEAETEVEQINYTRKKPEKEKKTPIRIKISDHFPRVEEIIEPDLIEPGSRKIGEEITEILEYNPAQIFVRKIIRPKYARPNNQGVVISELPSLPIPKGNAGASLLAYILVAKYVDHLPFYRQIQIFKRSKLYLTNSTMNGWFNKATDLLDPLYLLLEKEALNCDYLQADESPIGVQDSQKKGALFSGYQWVYRSPEQGLVLFKYHPGRNKDAPEETLKNFNGSLQTDGYIAYQSMETKGHIVLLACMAHARRYFDKALSYDNDMAEYMLKKIQKLYKIEKTAKERLIDQNTLQRYRSLYAKPVLIEIEQWLKSNINQVVPQSPIGKAINYTYNLWPRLKAYINNGKYEIDNNKIENAIRPLALGRKNYLFAGSHSAAKKAAMMYSFFATCKINEVNPLEWLTFVLERIQDYKTSQLNELLPRNWKTIKN